MLRRIAMLAAAVFTAAPAFALDMPARKPGLWQINMEFVGRKLPAQVIKQCIDAASDKIMNSHFGGSAQEACSKQDVTKTSNGMTVDSVCKFGEATTTSHAVVTGSFDSAYTVHVTSTREGGPPIPGLPPGGKRNRVKVRGFFSGAQPASVNARLPRGITNENSGEVQRRTMPP